MQAHDQKQDNINEVLELGASGKSPMTLRRLLTTAAVCLIVLAAALFAFMHEESQPVQYQTQEAAKGTLTVTVTATGNLEPTNNVTVGSELSGIVASVEAKENDWVKSGQVLARLDTRKLTAKVRQSRASLEAAQAKVLQTKATIHENERAYARLKKAFELSGGRIPSQEDLDAAEAAFIRARADEASAEAAVSQAQATLDSDLADLEKAVIVSPINGIVLTRNVEPGQTVAASLQAPTLFTLAQDLTRMELNVSVDEADVGRIKQGQEAAFTVDAYPDRTFQAQITRVSYGSQTSEGVVTYDTVLAVDNSDLTLRPGMTATAVITVQKVENTVLVPNAALRYSPDTGSDDAAKEKRSMVSRILPRPPSHRTSKQVKTVGNGSSEQKVWVLRNGQPAAVAVQTGATDGVMTEMVRGPVTPGMKLIIGTVSVQQ